MMRGGPPRYWELDRRRLPEMKTLAPELTALVRSLAPVLPSSGPRRRDGALRLAEIGAYWSRAVGEEMAALTRPTRFRGGVLTVEVDSAPLAAELESFARDHLLHALQGEGLDELCELRFRSGSRSTHSRPARSSDRPGTDEFGAEPRRTGERKHR